MFTIKSNHYNSLINFLTNSLINFYLVQKSTDITLASMFAQFRQ